MSITHEIVIWCDLCGVWERSSHTAGKARKQLKTEGWTRSRPARGYIARDFCRACSEKKAAAMADFVSGKINAEDLQIRYERQKTEGLSGGGYGLQTNC